MKDLIIIGAGGLGRDVAFFVERINSVTPTWNILGYFDANIEKGTLINGFPVLGDDGCVVDYSDVHYVCAIGLPHVKKRIVEKLLSLTGNNIKFASIVCPSVAISNSSLIGDGSIVGEQCVIHANSRIGKHVYLNSLSSLGHDTIVEDYCNITPGVNISGCCSIGECCDFGDGTKIIQGIKIAAHTVLGTGAVVVRDITESGTYVGVPVRMVKIGGVGNSRLIILGYGGHAKIVADIVRDYYKEIVFDTDDSIFEQPDIKKTFDAFVAIGDSVKRKELLEKLNVEGFSVPTFIHDSAEVADDVLIGKGVVVAANAVINSGSEIGDGVIVNTGATVDHDCKIGEYSHIAPGVHISGYCTIGKSVWVGTGASVIDKLSIADNATIGVGSAVVNDIKEEGTYYGVPAKLSIITKKGIV